MIKYKKNKKEKKIKTINMKLKFNNDKFLNEKKTKRIYINERKK